MSPTYGQILAQNIRAARSRIGIGQDTVAERMRALGYDAWIRQTVSSTERGRRRPVAEEMPGLAIALETSVWRLMAPWEDDKPVDLQPHGLREVPPAYLRGLVRGPVYGRIVWDGDKPAFVSREQIEGEWEQLQRKLGVTTLGEGWEAGAAPEDPAAGELSIRGGQGRIFDGEKWVPVKFSDLPEGQRRYLESQTGWRRPSDFIDGKDGES